MNEQIKKEVLQFIKTRAGVCSEEYILSSFGINQGELDEYLESLQEEGHVKCKVVEEYSYSYDTDQYEELCLRFRILTFLCKKKKVAYSEIISKYNPDKVWLKDTINQWEKLSYISINKHEVIIVTNILEEYLRKFLQMRVLNNEILDVRKNKKNQEITYADPKIIALMEDLKEIIRS